MKRMDEVFEGLPIISHDSNHLYETGSKWHISQFYSAEKAQHAAHAINHVDALADALDECMNTIAYAATISPKAMEQYSKAIAALAEYRGDK